MDNVQSDTLQSSNARARIERSELDRLQQAYKNAVNQWIAAVREEEALATPDHSIVAWERWEQAGFKAKEAEDRANVAKEAYKDGLRQLDYGF
jgi:hypothetical protein